MTSLTDTLGKQVGPLPMGAWIAVVAGGLGIGWYARSRGSSDTASEDDLATVPGGSGGLGGAIDLGGSTTPAGEPITPVPPVDNDEWARLVQRELTAAGYPVLAVDSMLRKFLMGEVMTDQEQQLYGVAILRVGPPPFLPPSVQDPPAPPNTTPPPTAIPPILPLVPPAVVTATHLGSGSYRITWTKVLGATGYQVRAVTGHTGDDIRTVGPDVTQYTTVRGIYQSGGHLAFEVRTVRGDATSAWRRYTVYGSG